MEEDDAFDIKDLNLSGNFDAQVSTLLTMVRLSREEVEAFHIIYSDLEEALGKRWPGCRVVAFGSIVTGLAIRSSDADCYIKLPYPPDTNPAKTVMIAKSCLARRPYKFTNLFAITGAKVPIVKFYHTPTQRNGDLSFTSHLGTRNSLLIGYLLKIDERALHLTVILKFWAKIHSLTGTNFMPTYAMILLVIFYLQQMQILPRIEWLQSESKDQCVIENWDTSYDVEFSNIPESTNDWPLHQLLGGFFKFFRDYKFTENIVSTYMGCSINRNVFRKLIDIPDEYVMYKHNIENGVCKKLQLDAPMCIQDPFQHDRNCSVAVHTRLSNLIISKFAEAAKLFDEDFKNNHKNFLRQILTKPEVVHINKPRRGRKLKPVKRLQGQAHLAYKYRVLQSRVANGRIDTTRGHRRF